MQEKSELEKRVADLERDLRRVRGVLAALLIAGVALTGTALQLYEPATALVTVVASALLLAASAIVLLLWRLQRPVPEVVQARKFEVVDQTGKVLVEIGETMEGGGAVVTRGQNAAGAHRATVTESAGAPQSAALALADDRENVQVELAYRGGGLYEARVTSRKAGLASKSGS